MLIKAASILKGKLDVTFVGDGESMEFLKDLAHSLNADAYIHFLGKQSQEYIAEHLSDYDLFVQPSRYEGFGLTVAEAMAAKVPVFVSSGQGPAEVTEGDKYGLVFENGDVQDLVKQLEYIFGHSQEVIEKTKLAYDHVRSHYDVEVTARKYLELY